jgi:hypothetical protein
MIDYRIQAGSRQCAQTGQEIPVGAVFYSVVFDENGSLVRKDFSEKAWTGPPAGSFGFWKTKAQPSTAKKSVNKGMDDELVLECFHRLEGQNDPNKVSFRYVLALLLMRKKRLRLEDTRKEQGRETMILRCLRTGNRVDVADPGLSDAQLESVQEDVFRVLGWD